MSNKLTVVRNALIDSFGVWDDMAEELVAKHKEVIVRSKKDPISIAGEILEAEGIEPPSNDYFDEKGETHVR